MIRRAHLFLRRGEEGMIRRANLFLRRGEEGMKRGLGGKNKKNIRNFFFKKWSIS